VTAVESVPTGDTLHWRVTFAYFDEEGRPRESADQIFIDHEIGLLRAGMEPADVPARVVEALGEKIEAGLPVGSRLAVAYSYDGQHFVVRDGKLSHYPDKAAALAALS
jgi:hypothetical protein